MSFSLTDVIVKCFRVKFLMDPVPLNLKNLLTAGILFPKRSSQNHFQFFYFITAKKRGNMFVLLRGKSFYLLLCYYCESVCLCEGHESFLLALKAVCSRQDPTGVNQDSSTSVKVFLETGLVNVNDRLPRLLRDVALSAPKHAERRVIQGVV